MPTKSYLLIFLISISFVQAQKNVKKYYYPLGKKKTVAVYKYVNKNDTTHVEYWKVITSPKDQSIKTISYDKDFRVYNVFEEIITKKGAKLSKYTDYRISDTGKNIPMPATIVESDVYLWKSTETFSYAVTYTSKYGHSEFTKSRTFDGIERITVNGKQYKVAVFKDDYHIYIKDYNDSYSYPQRTYYAKHIGMVKYERKLPNEKTPIKLELTEILTETAFKDLQR
ncbi:hypothetical protein [Kordia sp.]|uniref:hypothetical protein n=1 Tax=Kordia sp. TaxID=1965332 RepID=UPI0025B8B330|nr:hypothetical protein [Kordia sp.]MCH2193256.1 hypothetical protein [Kordia sp.]